VGKGKGRSNDGNSVFIEKIHPHDIQFNSNTNIMGKGKGSDK